MGKKVRILVVADKEVIIPADPSYCGDYIPDLVDAFPEGGKFGWVSCEGELPSGHQLRFIEISDDAITSDGLWIIHLTPTPTSEYAADFISKCSDGSFLGIKLGMNTRPNSIQHNVPHGDWGFCFKVSVGLTEFGKWLYGSTGTIH